MKKVRRTSQNSNTGEFKTPIDLAWGYVENNGYIFSVDEEGVPDHVYIGLANDDGSLPPDATSGWRFYDVVSWDECDDFDADELEGFSWQLDTEGRPIFTDRKMR